MSREAVVFDHLCPQDKLLGQQSWDMSWFKLRRTGWKGFETLLIYNDIPTILLPSEYHNWFFCWHQLVPFISRCCRRSGQEHGSTWIKQHPALSPNRLNAILFQRPMLPTAALTKGSADQLQAAGRHSVALTFTKWRWRWWDSAVLAVAIRSGHSMCSRQLLPSHHSPHPLRKVLSVLHQTKFLVRQGCCQQIWCHLFQHPVCLATADMWFPHKCPVYQGALEFLAHLKASAFQCRSLEMHRSKLSNAVRWTRCCHLPLWWPKETLQNSMFMFLQSWHVAMQWLEAKGKGTKSSKGKTHGAMKWGWGSGWAACNVVVKDQIPKKKWAEIRFRRWF